MPDLVDQVVRRDGSPVRDEEKCEERELSWAAERDLRVPSPCLDGAEHAEIHGSRGRFRHPRFIVPALALRNPRSASGKHEPCSRRSASARRPPDLAPRRVASRELGGGNREQPTSWVGTKMSQLSSLPGPGSTAWLCPRREVAGREALLEREWS